MRSLYSIGETAELTGVTVQTLRLYDRKGLVRPAYINEANGYRYYTHRQFHLIDRIKYLQKLGMRLTDIQEALAEGTSEPLVKALEAHANQLYLEKEKLEAAIGDVTWYRSYFEYMRQRQSGSDFYELAFDNRYVLAVSCSPEDSLEQMELNLAELKNSPPFKGLNYVRQYGYILEDEALADGKFKPIYYFIYLKQPPMLPSEFVKIIPRGNYLCTQGQLCAGVWDREGLKGQLGRVGKPAFILANEFEDDLTEFNHANYEIQIRL